MVSAPQPVMQIAPISESEAFRLGVIHSGQRAAAQKASVQLALVVSSDRCSNSRQELSHVHRSLGLEVLQELAVLAETVLG